MNLSPALAGLLSNSGHDVVHWSEIGSEGLGLSKNSTAQQPEARLPLRLERDPE